MVDLHACVGVDVIGTFCALDNRHAFYLGYTNLYIYPVTSVVRTSIVSHPERVLSLSKLKVV